MKNTFNKITGFICIIFCILFITSCSKSDSSTTLKVGVIAGTEADIMQKAIEIAKRDFDLDVKLVEFSDYVSPNLALENGSIDINAYQHKPYLDKVIQEQKFDFVAVGSTFIYPLAAYSTKIQNIADLKPKAKIAIPNDPTNGARALMLLHNNGIIKLAGKDHLDATVADISENPNNYKFIELDAAQLPRSLEDVDLAIINSSFSVPYGLIPNKDGLLIESKDSPYVNLIVAKAGNEQNSKIQDLIKAYQTEEIIKLAEKLFNGAAVPGWK
jgi:D-methionine transport system substrate-binding protein